MKFSDSQICQLVQQHYQLQGELQSLPGYCDQNALLIIGNAKYVVKVCHSGEALVSLQMQNAAMAHLSDKGLAVPRALENTIGQTITEIKTDDEHLAHLRVLTYLPGSFYADLPKSSHGQSLWRALGAFMGQIDVALEDFEHQGAYRYLDWDLAQGYRVCMTKKSHLNAEQQQLLQGFLDTYRIHTLPLLGQLPTGVIHNDANDYNVLVGPEGSPTAIAGLIDFGDVVHSQLVNELAITAVYAMLHQAEPFETLKQVTVGYHSVRPLNALEIEVLFSLVALRLCVSVCNSAAAIKAEPDNQYLMISAQPAWTLLKQLAKVNAFAVQCQLRAACGLPVDSGKNPQAIVEYRQQHLSKTLSLSYQQPLKIVRGQGAWLYDQSGNGFLDMVNNVCHVGHCHPKVVAAGQAQMAKLNTNTRYLHDNLVNYVEALLATLPSPLSVVMLVNSGSEANELAFRLARCYSGSKELLCVDGAYHGNTAACIAASPYKFNGPGGMGSEPFIHTVELPDPYRGPHADVHGYVESVRQRLAELTAEGKKPGAFICESLHGVAGQIIMPDGYLQAVYPLIRQAGGVCIADEVQVGFGRVGSHMWAFETQQVVPDIVTLGKPIGNGHPMAAVVTTQAIADAFVTGMEYFNTFGGNPVSCAIGLAVLETIEQEKLQQNALNVGGYLKQQLEQLQQQYQIIGDVRGKGLFIGVELVIDRQSKQPATKQTKALLEFAKARQVLLSSDGPFNNVLKIKPPMVFDKADADHFLSVFEQWLQTQPPVI